MRARVGVLVVVVALAAGSSVAAAGSAAPSPCGPAAAHTLAASGVARVYVLDGVVYGCSNRSRTQVRLGQSTTCVGRPLVGPVQVAGQLAGYGTETCGIDTGSGEVVVRRLSDGHQLRALAATTSPLAAESYQRVTSLVLKRDGAVAWIGVASSIVGHGEDIEVHRADRRGEARLDSGAGIDPGSLRLRGARLTWSHSGTRSATLE